MATESAVCDAPEQVNSIATEPTSADPCIDVTEYLRRAVDSKSSHKFVALAAGYDPSAWTRILSNERGVIVYRLGQLPLDVQREFLKIWADKLGLRFERADTSLKRVALSKLAEAAQALSEIV